MNSPEDLKVKDLEKSIETIKENKEVIIAALDSVLDTLYNYTDPLRNEKGNIKTALFKDQETQDLATGFVNDLSHYEDVRLKIKADDFNLDYKNVSYVVAALMFNDIRAKSTIESMIKAKIKLDEILEKIVS